MNNWLFFLIKFGLSSATAFYQWVIVWLKIKWIIQNLVSIWKDCYEQQKRIKNNVELIQEYHSIKPKIAVVLKHFLKEHKMKEVVD